MDPIRPAGADAFLPMMVEGQEQWHSNAPGASGRAAGVPASPWSDAGRPENPGLQAMEALDMDMHGPAGHSMEAEPGMQVPGLDSRPSGRLQPLTQRSLALRSTSLVAAGTPARSAQEHEDEVFAGLFRGGTPDGSGSETSSSFNFSSSRAASEEAEERAASDAGMPTIWTPGARALMNISFPSGPEGRGRMLDKGKGRADTSAASSSEEGIPERESTPPGWKGAPPAGSHLPPTFHFDPITKIYTDDNGGGPGQPESWPLEMNRSKAKKRSLSLDASLRRLAIAAKKNPDVSDQAASIELGADESYLRSRARMQTHIEGKLPPGWTFDRETKGLRTPGKTNHTFDPSKPKELTPQLDNALVRLYKDAKHKKSGTNPIKASVALDVNRAYLSSRTIAQRQGASGENNLPLGFSFKDGKITEPEWINEQGETVPGLTVEYRPGQKISDPNLRAVLLRLAKKAAAEGSKTNLTKASLALGASRNFLPRLLQEAKPPEEEVRMPEGWKLRVAGDQRFLTLRGKTERLFHLKRTDRTDSEDDEVTQLAKNAKDDKTVSSNAISLVLSGGITHLSNQLSRPKLKRRRPKAESASPSEARPAVRRRRLPPAGPGVESSAAAARRAETPPAGGPINRAKEQSESETIRKLHGDGRTVDQIALEKGIDPELVIATLSN